MTQMTTQGEQTYSSMHAEDTRSFRFPFFHHKLVTSPGQNHLSKLHSQPIILQCLGIRLTKFDDNKFPRRSI